MIVKSSRNRRQPSFETLLTRPQRFPTLRCPLDPDNEGLSHETFSLQIMVMRTIRKCMDCNTDCFTMCGLNPQQSDITFQTAHTATH